MTAVTLIRDLADTGIRVTAHGDRLHVEATAGTLTPQLRQQLADNKADILAALTDRKHVRAHLEELATTDGLNPALVDRIPSAELHLWTSYPDTVLTAGLRTLADDADREAGRVPIADRAVALCRSCGPVWAHAAIAAGSPLAGGWPYLLGCPWCSIHKRGLDIPRPHVACADCRNRIPDRINPHGGMGRCGLAPDETARMYHPHQKHRCGDWRAVEA